MDHNKIARNNSETQFHRDGDSSGVTLREWLAGMALQGLLAKGNRTAYDCAEIAVEAADHLLIALEENPWTAKPGT